MGHLLGEEWGEAQRALPVEARHPIMRWRSHFIKFQKTLTKGPDGMYLAQPDGVTTDYLLLAYDLWVLSNHRRLQGAVLRRLRANDHFAGTRYEFLSRRRASERGSSSSTRTRPTRGASTRNSSRGSGNGVRDGCGGKGPGTRRRVTHPRSKAVSPQPVAATSRPQAAAAPVRGLSRCEHAALAHAASLVDDVNDAMARLSRDRGRAPFEAVLCTNRPHQYGEFAEPSPPNDYFIWVATDCRIPDDVGGRLFTAMSRLRFRAEHV